MVIPSPQKMPPKSTPPDPPKKQPEVQQSQQAVQKPSKSSIDYQLLLLALADEYLNAAHSQGTLIALSKNEVELEEYYKLVATGLGCLEAVLRVCTPMLAKNCSNSLIVKAYKCDRIGDCNHGWKL